MKLKKLNTGKKLLLIFISIALFSCSKEEDPCKCDVIITNINTGSYYITTNVPNACNNLNALNGRLKSYEYVSGLKNCK